MITIHKRKHKTGIEVQRDGESILHQESTEPDRKKIDIFSLIKNFIYKNFELTIILLFSIFYFSVSSFLANRRLLWTDELLTLYLARLPWSTFWNAMNHGPEAMPPLNFILTKLSLQTFGESHVSVRLPALVGYWMMSLAIYYLVRPAASAMFSAVAMLFPMTTLACEYSIEARPYGMLLGFGSVAVLCWHRSACVGQHRIRWLFGLTLSSAAVVSLHWYGTLLLMALIICEASRCYRAKKVDFDVLASILLGLAILLALRPMFQNSLTFRDAAGKPVPLKEFFGVYNVLFRSSALALLAILLGLAAPRVLLKLKHDRTELGHTPDPDILAVSFCLLAIPMAGTILTNAVGGALGPRYVLPTVIGAAILIGIAAQSLSFASGEKRTGRLVLGLVVLACILRLLEVKNGMQERSWIGEYKAQFALLETSRQTADFNQPIITNDCHSFMQLIYYSDKSISRRLVYITGYSPQADRMIQRLADFVNIKTNNYNYIIKNNKKLLLYIFNTNDDTENSQLLPNLVKDGAWLLPTVALDTRNIYPRPGQLYQVVMDGRCRCPNTGNYQPPLSTFTEDCVSFCTPGP